MIIYPQMNVTKFVALMDNLTELILLDVNPDHVDAEYHYDILKEIAEAKTLAKGGAIKFE